MTPMSVLGLINILSDLYSSVIQNWNFQLKSNFFLLRNYRVNLGHNLPPLSVMVIGLRNVYQAVRLC